MGKFLFPISVAGLLLGAALFVLYWVQFARGFSSLPDALNNAQLFTIAMAAFGLVSISTIIASKAGMLSNSLVRGIYQASTVCCATLFLVLLVYVALLGAWHGV